MTSYGDDPPWSHCQMTFDAPDTEYIEVIYVLAIVDVSIPVVSAAQLVVYFRPLIWPVLEM